MLTPGISQNKTIELNNVLDGTFRTSGIGSYNWVNGEDAYYFSESDSDGKHFYIYNLASDDTTKAFSINTDIIDQFSSTFSDNQTKLLLKTNSIKIWRHSSYGTYHVYDINTDSIQPVSDDPDSLRNVKFSPNSEHVSYVRNDNNLYIYSLNNLEETQLTFDGSETILNGHFGWVYEEEFGSYDAYRWSPNSQYIAFCREDQSMVRKYPLIDYGTKYPTVKYIYYPKAGEDNPEVSIGLIDIVNEQADIRTLPKDSYYIPNILWQRNSNNFFVTTLNRKQNDWKLYRHDIDTNQNTLVLNDKNDTWIDAFDFFGMSGVFTIDILNNGEIIWMSERDGFKHIYRSHTDGKFINQITRGKWEVNGINAIDEENEIIYFNAKKESEMEDHVYSVKFNGSRLKRLTKEKGSHSASFSPTKNYFINTHSSFTRTPKTVLRSNSGAIKRTLAATDKSKFDEYGFTYPRHVHLFTDDGTRLNGMITLPHNFDSMSQYPVILYNYGGPGSQMVKNRWGAGNHSFHQYFAQRGFIIFSFDNRGTGGRGKAFKDFAYGDYGKYLVIDHIVAAKYLQSLTYVNGDNIGVWGWSGGGYLTNMCMTLGSDYFKAGVSVAPNVDPLLYDTIWTERYMGLVDENSEGYKNTSVLTHVDKAKGFLLQIHGNADDNVHHQHSLQLAKAYAEKGKHMEMFIYPNAHHGLGNNNFLTSKETKVDGLANYNHVYNKISSFLIEHLSSNNQD
ncbi:MAG: S9 family peptidase [bacterium]